MKKKTQGYILIGILLTLALVSGGMLAVVYGTEWFEPTIHLVDGRLVSSFSTEYISGVASDDVCHAFAFKTFKFLKSDPSSQGNDWCQANYPGSFSFGDECWLTGNTLLNDAFYQIEVIWESPEGDKEGYIDGSSVCVSGISGSFGGYWKIQSISKTRFGEWQPFIMVDLDNVGAPPLVRVGEKIRVTGFADIEDGTCENCIIETTMQEELGATKGALSVLSLGSTDISVCGNDLSAGIKFSGVEGDSIVFALEITARETGNWRIPVYSASDCTANGGLILDTEYVEVEVIDAPEPPTIPPIDDPIDEDDEPEAPPAIDDPGDVIDDEGTDSGNTGNDYTGNPTIRELIEMFISWLKGLFTLG